MGIMTIETEAMCRYPVSGVKPPAGKGVVGMLS